jgi:hypothetical protein
MSAAICGVCAWCAGPVTGRQVTCSARCRQARSRWLRAVWDGVRWVRCDTRTGVEEQAVLPVELLGMST